ncbi:MAG: hypothetical protein LBQ14_04090 [Treponema sp.]|jgi:hypothetical protein|nr:hypothetical protein [Treponema sp.]
MSGWMPGPRTEILEMCRAWIEYMAAARRTAWGVPQEKYNELLGLFDTAQALLRQAMDKAERTHVITVECQAAFKALKEAMRFLRDRYFKRPPLLPGDWAALGFREEDPPSPSPAPSAETVVETYLVGRHELGMKIVYVSGNPRDKENKGYRIWYKVVGPGETAPADPEQLTKSFYTRRKRDVVQFAYGDSGKTAYIAVQVENDGKKGPWGPMVSAVIP